MDKLNCQIQQIENGFLVLSTETKLVQTPNGLQPMPQHIPTYCADYEAVCLHLKSLWPKDIL